MASSSAVLALAVLDRSFWQLLTETTLIGLLLPKLCHANPIQLPDRLSSRWLMQPSKSWLAGSGWDRFVGPGMMSLCSSGGVLSWRSCAAKCRSCRRQWAACTASEKMKGRWEGFSLKLNGLKSLRSHLQQGSRQCLPRTIKVSETSGEGEGWKPGTSGSKKVPAPPNTTAK